MAPLTPLALYTWRDTISDLCPNLLIDPTATQKLFTKTLCDDLNEFFTDLNQTPFTRTLVKETQIHTAFKEMAEPGGGWPEGYVKKAELALEKLEKEVGGLKGLGGGLWDEDGKLEGCVEVRDRMWKKGWVVQMKEGKTVEDALKSGDLGFRVGSWWINTAAAMRDGIISSIEDCISGNKTLAYAVVITGDDEMVTGTDEEFKLRLWRGAWRRALGKNLTAHRPVRVLRDHKLNSPRAPRVGVRYDGLYSVSTHGQQRHPLPNGGEIFEHTYTMVRVKDQGSLAQALYHPDLREIKDWEKYLLEKREKVEFFEDVDMKEGAVVGWLPEEEQSDDSSIVVAGPSTRPS